MGWMKKIKQNGCKIYHKSYTIHLELILWFSIESKQYKTTHGNFIVNCGTKNRALWQKGSGAPSWHLKMRGSCDTSCCNIQFFWKDPIMYVDKDICAAALKCFWMLMIWCDKWRDTAAVSYLSLVWIRTEWISTLCVHYVNVCWFG